MFFCIFQVRQCVIDEIKSLWTIELQANNTTWLGADVAMKCWSSIEKIINKEMALKYSLVRDEHCQIYREVIGTDKAEPVCLLRSLC